MHKIDQAFILGAGKGTRLRPHTDTKPKPMVKVAKKPLIDHIIDQLSQAGIQKIAVNTHYKADILESHLKEISEPEISVSYEEELLNTGGGIKNALHFLDNKPFFVINGDSYCIDGPEASALKRLEDMWDPEIMDILILLHPVSKMALTQGVGDYIIQSDGKAIRSRDKCGTHMFTSIRINHPRIFDDTPEGSFSYLDLMDHAQKSGRLYALEHDGDWHHISTPQDLENVNTSLKNA